MRSSVGLLACLLLMAGLAGCLGGSEPLEEANTTRDPNASNESPGPRQVRSEPLEGNGTDEPSGNGTVQNGSGPRSNSSASLEPLAFTDPVHLNPRGFGFEPSVEVGPDGTVVATAARGLGSPTPPEQRASWLWSSRDRGANWSRLPSPQQVHAKQPAFEGEIAIDGEGRVYFVDTYLADNTLSRWSNGSGDYAWDFSRPVQGSSGVDDRPWLAAHGDGIVYYVGNNGPAVPAANNLQAAERPARIWIYPSTDGGQTWGPGHGFARSWWCTPAASPADASTVAVHCSRMQGTYTFGYHGLVEGYEAVVYTSTDRGQSWTASKLKTYDAPPADGFPTVAFDQVGTPYAVWNEGTDATSLYMAHRVGGSWSTLEVTPFEGTIHHPWVAAGDDGRVAIAFYGTQDADPGGGSSWHAWAMVTENADAPSPTWTLARVSEDPVAQGDDAPDDFLQADLSPRNALHVVFDDETSGTNRVLFARQTQGPNLAPR